MITKHTVGKPQEPNYNYTIDLDYDIDNGYNENINYSTLKTITPEMSKRLWDEVDMDILHEMKYFVHNVQKGWEVKYGLIPETDYITPEDALHLDVEYFAQWATSDNRLRYICENIVTNPNIGLIDKIGNGLASHFYGARGVHHAMTGESDPKKALLDYTKLAKEQMDFKESGEIGEYTKHIREFFQSQKLAGAKFWGTTELHTSIQTAGRRFVNEWYLGERRHENKGTTANVAEWIASWKNSGLLQEMIDNSGIKSMFNILTTEEGCGDYYGFHGASDLALCPELNAYIDERFVVPGPGAVSALKMMYPNLSKKDISYADRIIWIRENQKELLDLPMIHEYFHEFEANGLKIFPEKINDIKTVQAEVLHCQFGIFLDLRANPHKISKRKVSNNTIKSDLVSDLLNF